MLGRGPWEVEWGEGVGITAWPLVTFDLLILPCNIRIKLIDPYVN